MFYYVTLQNHVKTSVNHFFSVSKLQFFFFHRAWISEENHRWGVFLNHFM